MRGCLVITFVILFVIPLKAQDRKDQNQTTDIEPVKHSLYMELGGGGIALSLNYEYRVRKNVWGRVGAGYLPGPFVEYISLPIGISYLLGKEVNFFEMGLVATAAYAEVEFSFDSKDDNKEFGMIFSPTIGYRYQPSENNLFFKIAFTPLLTTFETRLLPSGGLSVGYSF